MNNAQISDVFDEIADLLEFQDANAFRVRAYRNAARTIRDLGEPLASILQDSNRKLTDIAGIGDDLAGKIAVLIETGDLPMRKELAEKVPVTVRAMMRVPGLGPKKAAALFHELNVSNLDELRAACEAGQVRELKGFGEKTEKAILDGLSIAAASGKRFLWADADVFVQDLLAHLKACKSIRQIEPAGSYRRGRETVGDLDVLVTSDDPREVMDRLATFERLAEVVARGETKMAIRLASGLQIDLRVVPEESFGAALQYFTGSKDHNVIIRGRAKDRGLKINEYGVFRGEDCIAGRTEEEIYALLDLPLFPPEIREARQEFAWAEAGKLPKLVEPADIRGDLHMHTTESDGRDTLEDMVAAAQSRGLKYIAITDHSKRVSMANGLDGLRLRMQWAEIDKLNKRLDGLKVLKGVEVDILERGGLDLPDDVLAEADWVVASVHYGQNQPRERITQRIVEALENPHVSAIAHPTGRLIGRREAYQVDLETVFQTAAKHGKLMELNANPLRLDLDDVHCAAAKRHGIPIVISTDAHSTNELDKMRYGILQARRAGLTKADVANTRTWAQMRKLVGR